MSDRLTELRVSARGWHGVQLAVIGFIGLCGVLQGGRPDNPMWLQVFAGIAALAALAIACLATLLVALVAWPLYGGRQASDDAAELERDGRRLKQGLVLTFLALALLALGTASGWWPQDEGAARKSRSRPRAASAGAGRSPTPARAPSASTSTANRWSSRSRMWR